MLSNSIGSLRRIAVLVVVALLFAAPCGSRSPTTSCCGQEFLSSSTAASESSASSGYRSRYVRCVGIDRESTERECDAILARLFQRYGVPKRWRVFPVRVEPGRGGSIAGYTLYRAPDVLEVVCYQTLADARGGVLDHELTHAFFFYLLGSNFDLFFNEGVAQNSEYRNRAQLRDRVWNAYQACELLPLDALYGRNEYDGKLLIYTQGFSVVDFLIGRGGSRWFAAFLDALTAESNGIGATLDAFYGYGSLDELEAEWLAYVRSGQTRSRTRSVKERYRDWVATRDESSSSSRESVKMEAR